MTSLRPGLFCNLLSTWKWARNLSPQCALMHTSSSFNGSSQRHSKKKIIKPVKVKEKSTKPKGEVVNIKPCMTISELATLLNRSHDQIFEAIGYAGATVKHESPSIMVEDMELIKKLVRICGCRSKMASNEETKKTLNEKQPISKQRLPDPSKMVTRPPIVTIMGHVDHGKTTLLDSLRDSNIVGGEFGGITQHIGAFSVKLKNGESVTFLDTPGHAAFHAMRARGADVTDIVVLVVAADDGVMKQTVESIKFANEAGVPIIVAINKIDKPKLDLERVKNELLEHDVIIEEYGGDVQLVMISALKGTNLDSLLECILAQAEIMDLKADPTCHVQAVCIESRTDIMKGKLATILIEHGTLKRGQIVVTGKAHAKVRGMFNDQGRPVDVAKPGTSVEVMGWKALPSAGDRIVEVDTEKEAKKMIDDYLNQESSRQMEMDNEVIRKKMEEERKVYNELRRTKLEKGYRKGSVYNPYFLKDAAIEDPTPKLNIIIKGDVDGTVEAILDIIDSYSCDKCRLNVLSYGVGPVTENDVKMAGLFKGIIYAFNVDTLTSSKDVAKTEGVMVLNFKIIYKLINSLIEKLNEQLPKILVDEIIGQADVKTNFIVTDKKRKVNVAGCRCIKGQLNKKKLFRLVRNGEVLFEGHLRSMKRFKDEVTIIKNDTECGLSFEDKDVQPEEGDVIECFDKVGKNQFIEWDLSHL